MAEDMDSSSPGTPVTRRAVSMPARPTEHNLKGSPASNADSQVETLFIHPSVRIVQFTTTAKSIASPSSGSHSVEAEEEVGTLPWTSKLERTIAVGPLRVYKAPGSVAFLNCGRVVQAILPKSRCWCVDDASSKFVLQRRPQFWRIEVPTATADDLRLSEEFKDVLSQILLFEKTPCPFRRSFTVELPEPPKTPIKKRPWKPVERPVTSSPAEVVPTSFTEAEDVGQVSENSDESSILGDPGDVEKMEPTLVVSNDNEVLEEGSDTSFPDDMNVTPKNNLRTETHYTHEMLSRPEAMQKSRSVTCPPQLTLITSPPSKSARSSSPLRRSETRDSISSENSIDSFHSVQSFHSPITPLPPSPPQSNPTSPATFPYPHENISVSKRTSHMRDVSELTIIAGSPRTWNLSRTSSPKSLPDSDGEFSTPPPRTPTLVDDIEDNLDEEHFEIVTPPKNVPTIRHRPTTGSNSRRRALSPLPPAANIFSPSRRRPRHLQTARHIPTAIIQKTCEILLSPPSHLFHIMLDIAARISAGEWKGMIFGFGEGGEKIVGQWDYEDGEPNGETWEDDYGISLAGPGDARRRTSNHGEVGGSWEVD